MGTHICPVPNCEHVCVPRRSGPVRRAVAIVFGLVLLLCGVSVAIVVLMDTVGDQSCWRDSATALGCSFRIAIDVVPVVLIAWFGETLFRRAFRIGCPVCRKGNMVDLTSERGTVLLIRKERRAATSKNLGDSQPFSTSSRP